MVVPGAWGDNGFSGGAAETFEKRLRRVKILKIRRVRRRLETIIFLTTSSFSKP
jgi:hypothetical protein